MTHKIFNASNMLGVIAFFAMIGTVGTAAWAIENEGSYWSTIALIIVLATCTYLSIKEDGKKR